MYRGTLHKSLQGDCSCMQRPISIYLMIIYTKYIKTTKEEQSIKYNLNLFMYNLIQSESVYICFLAFILKQKILMP